MYGKSEGTNGKQKLPLSEQDDFGEESVQGEITSINPLSLKKVVSHNGSSGGRGGDIELDLPDRRYSPRRRFSSRVSSRSVRDVFNAQVDSYTPEKRRLILAMLSHPNSETGVEIAKLLKTPGLDQVVRAFNELSPEDRKNRLYSHYGQHIPAAYRITTPKDIEKVPLYADFIKSAYEWLHNGKSYYAVHLVVNGVIYLGIGALALSDPIFLSKVVFAGARVTILESSLEAGCRSLMDPDFLFVDPVTGSLGERLILTNSAFWGQAVYGTLLTLGPRLVRVPLMALAVYLYKKAVGACLKSRESRRNIALDRENPLTGSQLREICAVLSSEDSLVNLLNCDPAEMVLDAATENPERFLKFMACFHAASADERKRLCSTILNISKEGKSKRKVRFPRMADALEVDTSEGEPVPQVAGPLTAIYQRCFLGRKDYCPHLFGACVAVSGVVITVVIVGAASPYLSVVGAAIGSIPIPGNFSERCRVWNDTGFPDNSPLQGPLVSLAPSNEGLALTVGTSLLLDVALPALYSGLQLLGRGIYMIPVCVSSCCCRNRPAHHDIEEGDGGVLFAGDLEIENEGFELLEESFNQERISDEPVADESSMQASFLMTGKTRKTGETQNEFPTIDSRKSHSLSMEELTQSVNELIISTGITLDLPVATGADSQQKRKKQVSHFSSLPNLNTVEQHMQRLQLSDKPLK